MWFLRSYRDQLQFVLAIAGGQAAVLSKQNEPVAARESTRARGESHDFEYGARLRKIFFVELDLDRTRQAGVAPHFQATLVLAWGLATQSKGQTAIQTLNQVTVNDEQAVIVIIASGRAKRHLRLNS